MPSALIFAGPAAAAGSVAAITGISRAWGRDDGSVYPIDLTVGSPVGSNFVVQFTPGGTCVGTLVSGKVRCVPPALGSSANSYTGTASTISIGGVQLATPYTYLPAWAAGAPDFYEDCSGGVDGAVYKPRASDGKNDPAFVNYTTGSEVRYSSEQTLISALSLKLNLVPSGGTSGAALIIGTSDVANGPTRSRGFMLFYDMYMPSAAMTEFMASGPPMPGNTGQLKHGLFRKGGTQVPNVSDGWDMPGSGRDFQSDQLRIQDDATTGGIFTTPSGLTIVDRWLSCVSYYKRDTVNHLGYMKKWYDGQLIINPAASARFGGDVTTDPYIAWPGAAYAEHPNPAYFFIANISAWHGCPI